MGIKGDNLFFELIGTIFFLGQYAFKSSLKNKNNNKVYKRSRKTYYVTLQYHFSISLLVVFSIYVTTINSFKNLMTK